MTEPGPRRCDRCDTDLVPGLSFCPKCGHNTADPGGRAAAGPKDHENPPVDALGRRFDSPAAAHVFVDRSSRGPAIVAGAVIVAVGLVLFGLLMRPQSTNAPTSLPAGSSGVPGPGEPTASPPALIVGLTIQSPPDGQVIATKDVTVIGLAPPGLSVTRDVSFGLDQHATADGTGHWAINVSLNNGQNDLVFRIGDDHSTEQRLRVTYKP